MRLDKVHLRIGSIKEKRRGNGEQHLVSWGGDCKPCQQTLLSETTGPTLLLIYKSSTHHWRKALLKTLTQSSPPKMYCQVLYEIQLLCLFDCCFFSFCLFSIWIKEGIQKVVLGFSPELRTPSSTNSPRRVRTQPVFCYFSLSEHRGILSKWNWKWPKRQYKHLKKKTSTTV